MTAPHPSPTGSSRSHATRSGTLILPALLLLSAAGAASLAPTLAAEPETSVPGPDRGWHAVVAPSAETLLTKVDTQPLEMPAWLAEKVKRRTWLYYFSPNCWHCEAALPEIMELSVSLADQVDFLGIASGSSDPQRLEAWKAQHSPTFPILRDEDHLFANATGLDATPALVIVDPATQAGSPILGVTEAYLPYVRGSGRILEMRARNDPKPVLSRRDYQGILTCASCHPEEAQSWTLTAHSLSYYRLEQAAGMDNASCLGCHVTNFQGSSAKASPAHSFQTGDHTSPFAKVTCESCHTPSGPHDGQTTDPRASCARCHNESLGIPFDLARSLPAIDHFLSGTLDPERAQLLRLDLADGRHSKANLTWPQGETSPASACKGCHKQAWKTWKKSRHAKAPGTLSDQEREHFDCLRCHSTPKGGTELPKALSDLNAAEGVSCDACHGPSAAHVRDPQHNKPRSLKSANPECAVEPICKSCHTVQWDPNWNMKARLQAIEHGR